MLVLLLLGAADVVAAITMVMPLGYREENSLSLIIGDNRNQQSFN